MNGVTVIEDYLSSEQADSLVKKVELLFGGGSATRDRSIRRFGSRKPYGGDFVGAKIPPFLENLIDGLVFDDLCKEPDHVTVNKYYPGQSIPFHVDSKESGEVIVILSLGSDASMILRNVKNKNDMQIVELPKNSLLLLQGAARWDYQHSINPVKSIRYSLVFRKSN